MAKEKKQVAADFRYDTGTARVPWAAVGEAVNELDTIEIVKFLCQPAAGKTTKYQAQLKRVNSEIKKLSTLSLPAGKLSLGQHVKALEQQTAKMLKAKHTVFLTNATAGFEIAYQYAGLGPGDEVIAPAITFIATIAYPLSIGAKVVLADVDPRTINMDPADVMRKVTRKTKVIIPVHIGGYPVDMAPIMKIARRHNITVIEDAAHAFGGQYHGKMLGTIGHFGSFSFHEVKNINALGEGGILVTNLPYGKHFAQTRFLGVDMSRKIPNWLYDVTALKTKVGYTACGNHSSTEVQAICLINQVKRLKQIIAKRRQAATYLTRRFEKVDGIIPQLLDNEHIKSTYHLYLLQIDPQKVDADVQILKKKLTERGIVQIPHFAPLYKFSVMRQLGYDTKAIEKSCPTAEEVFNHRFTHLPLYDLDKKQLAYMADAVIESVQEIKRSR